MRYLRFIGCMLCLILLSALCSGALAQEAPKVGISCPYRPDGWLAAARCAAETAAEKMGMRYMLKAATSAAEQIEDIELMCEQGYETIVLFPLSDAVEAAARRAQKAGVTLFCFGSVPGKLKPAQWMVVDAENTGAQGAAYLAEQLGGQGRVAILVPVSDPIGEGCASACRAALKETYPKMEIVGTYTADAATAEAGQALMNEVLDANPELDGVYICDAALVPGVLRALEEQGRLGAGSVRALISCGGSREIFRLMDAYKGSVHLAAQLFAPNALGELVRLCNGSAEGETFEDAALLPEMLDAENCRKWMLQSGITDEVPF